MVTVRKPDGTSDQVPGTRFALGDDASGVLFILDEQDHEVAVYAAGQWASASNGPAAQ